MLDFSLLRNKYAGGETVMSIRNNNFLNRLESNIANFEKLRKFYCITAYEDIYKEIKKLIGITKSL